MKPPRGLTAEEAALWARVATTVTPLGSKPQVRSRLTQLSPPPQGGGAGGGESATGVRRAPPPNPPPSGRGLSERASVGLDGSWDRKLAQGAIQPDFTLDLHGASLDAAHGRLLHGLAQAKAMGARVVLLVTGKPRPADPADRTGRRGAIRAKIVDWLAASEHAGGIAAIRGAHPRHGGQGALYIVLRRKR